MKSIKQNIKLIIELGLECFISPFLILFAVISRFVRKKIDVGLGPEPLINNVYHKKALLAYNYLAETFVDEVYYITDQFDVRIDQFIKSDSKLVVMIRNLITPYYAFARAVFRYKCLYIYFNGGPIGLRTKWLWRYEPFFYKLAGMKVVVMPYGGDVQDMSRSSNLIFKNAMSKDYPIHRFRREKISKKIDLWTKYADHVISGCEWVDYMYHWDTLMLAHFSIDVNDWKVDHKVSLTQPVNRKIRILHAPNHKAIKGTRYFIDAVNELAAEGLDVELVILEKVANKRIKDVMASVDIVADQLIVGWYAMFALEAMSMEKPVLCYLRQDLENLYIAAGLLEPGENPIVRCNPITVKQTIKDMVLNRDRLIEIGRRSRQYVIKHHSIDAVGGVFNSINRKIGIR